MVHSTFQTEHMEDKFGSASTFATMIDRRAEDIPPYLLLLFLRVITSAIKKLSKRPTSAEVRSVDVNNKSDKVTVLFTTYRSCKCGMKPTSNHFIIKSPPNLMLTHVS